MSKTNKTTGGAGKASRPASPRRAAVTAAQKAEDAAGKGPSQPSGPRLELGPDLRIAHAGACFGSLGAHSVDQVLTLDGEAVAKVDAAGLQALLAGLLARRSAGGRWHWHNPSGVLTHAAELLGLKGALELP